MWTTVESLEPLGCAIVSSSVAVRMDPSTDGIATPRPENVRERVLAYLRVSSPRCDRSPSGAMSSQFSTHTSSSDSSGVVNEAIT